MQDLLRLLSRHPELAIIVVIWVVGFIASMLQKAKKAQEARRRRESLPTMEVPRSEPSAPVAMPAPPPRATRQDPEAVAREMRRILGMEPTAGDTGVSTEPEPPLRRRPVADMPPSSTRPRWDPAPERAPTPVVPTTNKRHLEIHVDPHVGDGIRRRTAPVSGAVGAHALGELGGRGPTGERARRRVGSRLVDLHDLKRAIVLREIFDAPLGLRERHLDER